MRILKTLAVAGMLTLFATVAPTLAAPAQSPEAFVQGLVDNALTELKGQLPDAELKSRFRAMATQNFDLPYLSHTMLGRFGDGLSEGQRSTFGRLFVTYIIESHAKDFKEFADQSIRVTGSRLQDNDVVVLSQLTTGDPTNPVVRLDWTLHQAKEHFLVADIKITDTEGSMGLAQTHKDDIVSILKRQGFDALLRIITAKLVELK